MKLQHFTRILPVVTFACVLGLAPLAMAQSTMAPATPATPAPATMPAPAKASMASPVVKSTAAKLPSADKFKTVAAATAHCPNDTVVWSALSTSKSFHLATSKLYGKTKHGAYVCEKDALAAGYHTSKI
jgi:hypothetical protein